MSTAPFRHVAALGIFVLLPACAAVHPVGLSLADASRGVPVDRPSTASTDESSIVMTRRDDQLDADLEPRSMFAATPDELVLQDPAEKGERRRRVGSWRNQPRGRFAFSFGLVDFEHEEFAASGATTLDDEARAGVAKFEFEGFRRGFGGGVNLELISVRDDLHDSQVGITSSDTDSWELYGHFSARPVAGNHFRMPIRFGPFMHYLNQEIRGASPDDIAYFTLGLRFEIEPEIDIIRNEDQALSVFWGGKFFSGATVVDLETTAFDESFETEMAGFGLTTGVRFTARRFYSQIAYAYNFRTFDESDAEFAGGSFQSTNEADFTYDGFMFSMGVRW